MGSVRSDAARHVNPPLANKTGSALWCQGTCQSVVKEQSAPGSGWASTACNSIDGRLLSILAETTPIQPSTAANIRCVGLFYNLTGDDPMPRPTIAQKSPFPVAVESGKSYFWCACGKSSKQPFCDGSHKGSEFVPLKWDGVEYKTVYFCGCKHRGNAPLCDGSHQRL